MNPASRTLLIIDDSPEDRELYRRYLLRDREYSYIILEADLGQQGLDLWHQHQPDVVLLDYRLPDLDGLEFLSQLQPSTQEFCLPAIVLTGQGNEAIAVQAMKAGAQDYLVKGQITPEGLHLAVNGAIEAVQLRLQLKQRIERDHAIAQITRQIHQSLHLDRIFQTTVTEIRQFLHADRVLVFQLQPDGNGTVVAESVGSEWRSLLSSTIYDPCLAENYLQSNRSESVSYDPAFTDNYVERYRQGNVTAISDIHNVNIEPCHVELLAQFQVKANLVVPILHEDQFWGLLIAHHCAAPRTWQSLEIDFLKELATQVSIALRQAELYQQAKHELAERQQVEAELRESEERLRLALVASGMGTWDWNLQTGKISWSENLEVLFGLKRGEFDGSFEMFLSRLHPDDRDLVQSSVDRAIKTGEDYDIEFRVLYPDGTIRWAMSQGKVFYDQNGQPIRMAGIDIDITERKWSAEALRDSEERFRQLAENIDVVFWIRDMPENQVCYVSPAYQRLWGLNPEELYERQLNWADRILPEDRESTDRAFQEKAAAGEFDCEYRIVLPDGSIRWVRDRCFPLRDRAGEIYRFTGIAEDITDRKQTEIELQQSRTQLQQQLAEIEAIYHTAPIGLNVLDTDLRFVRINQRLAEINGYSVEAHIGRTIRELLPDLADATNRILRPILETGEPRLNVEMRGETPAQPGVPRIWLEHFAPLKHDERVIGISTVCEEITDRIQTELLLQENAARLKLAYKATRSGLWDWDITRNIVHVSEEYCHLFGFDPTIQEVSYEQWLSCLYPDDRTSATELVSHTFQQQRQYYEADYRILHPDGVRWLAARGQVFYNAGGDAVRMLGNVQDISDRKQVEEALRQSEERYRCLAESIPQLVWTANTEGALLDVNQRWSEFTGVTLEQIHTIGWERIIHPQDVTVLAQKWTEAVQKGTYYQAEGRMRRADGVYRWHLHQAIPQKNEQGQIVKWFGTATDIEAQKQLEVERDRRLQLEQTARLEAERANRIKDEFLAILSHELRSPLNPILGWTKLLQTRKFDETKTAEALATIERNAKLQCQLIDDLLDIAKILRGKLSVDAAPVNLVFIIESAIDTVRTAAISKSIQLHLVLPNIGQVAGDSTRLQQIVWNLLSNAIKFTPKGGQVEIRLERLNDMAQIIVRDTGKGINPNFLPHIFESFSQEDVSTTRKYGGLGLGLAIVRHLVEAHGGTICADSPGEGEGATFTVSLPLLNFEPEPNQTDELCQQKPDLTGIRVLTVDDDPDARELLTVLLRDYGAEVVTVSSAAEVFTALESFGPDILISDIGMPEVDGYTLLQLVRSLPPEKGGLLPAIALTAYAGEVDQQRALTVGFQQHITKPIDSNQLAQSVLILVRSK